MSDITQEARVLMEITADVTGAKIAKARKRLAVALDREMPKAAADLIEETPEMVGEALEDLQKLIIAARDRGVELYGDIRDKTVETAKAADDIVCASPYRSIGIALGVGAVVGFLTSFRHSRKS